MPSLALLSLLTLTATAEPLPPPPGEGTTLSAGAELTTASIYHWRGMTISHGPVLQPAVWLGVENVQLTAWGNLNLSDSDGRGPSELDLVLSVAQEWGEMSFVPALVLYVLPGASNTAEATGDFGWQPGALGLFSNHAIDFWDARPAWWSESGVLLEVPLPASLHLEGELGLGVGNRSFESYHLGEDQAGLLYTGGGLGLGWEHDSGLSVVIEGHLDALLAPGAHDAVDEAPVHGFGTLTVGWGGSTVWIR